jgi:hypothetical protein
MRSNPTVNQVPSDELTTRMTSSLQSGNDDLIIIAKKDGQIYSNSDESKIHGFFKQFKNWDQNQLESAG